jgi:hypothetical protein
MRASLLALVLFSSCASQKTAFIVTGESLKVLGNQAADVSAAMNKGLDEGKVKPEDYRVWAEFAKRFQLFYPTAVDTWNAAQVINDNLLAGQVGEAIGRMAAELGKFIIKLKKEGLIP